MTAVDFGRHSDDYARHRPGPPAWWYDRLDALHPLAGARALDLGTGPGKLALELARRGATVTGIDVAEEQIRAAGEAAAEGGLDGRACFRVGRAENTGLEAASFDLVTAGQAWHWFDADAALAEIRRVLRPGGVLAIVQYSYLARHSPVARATEDLILRFNPTWTMAGWTGLFPHMIDEVIEGGLDLVEQFCRDHPQPFTHAAWRGRMRTCNGVGSGGLSPEDVLRFDEELARMLARDHPEPLVVPHRVWCVLAQKADPDTHHG